MIDLAPSVKERPAMASTLADTLVRRVVPRPVPSEESLRRGTQLAALERLVSVRVYVAPVLSVLALTFALFEPSTWRRAVLGTVVVALMTISYVEWIRSRRSGLGAVNLTFNFLVMLCGQVALVVATGGLFSPIVPVLVLMSFLSSVLGDPRLQARAIAGLLVPAVWVMAVVHARFGLVPQIYGDPGALEGGVLTWLAAALYTVMLLASAGAGREIRRALERTLQESLRDRDQRLAMHAEQSRALSALSAEIAHELKNPLASVKGLGALVAKDLEGKPAERMGVLRREVDRMQEILEELLNFSRPLVPLAMERVDAGALADDVMRMHEGTADQLGVGMSLVADPVQLTCDPRKVRQILVNLVQNALQATDRDGGVAIRVDDDGDHVVFHVDDDGPGLEESMRERAFEAGVTTKDAGSGIGLVVARSLALQHGGELTLADREPRGCRATLRLPRAPEVEA